MICTHCEGKGIVPAGTPYHPGPWNGDERRNQERSISNSELKFNEVETALYQSCPACDGSGKIYENLLSTQR